MKQTNYIFYAVDIKDGSWARVYLNGLPLHTQFAPGVMSHSGSITHLLLDGDNTLSVDVFAAPERWTQGAVKVEFYIPLRSSAYELNLSMVHRFAFPEALGSAARNEASLPHHHESTFFVDNGGFSPLWADSPRLMALDPRGTPELHAAVREIYESVERLDTDGFLALNELRLVDYERAYPGIAAARAETRRGVIRDFFSHKPRLPTLDMSELHFSLRADGRVVLVTREAGGYVLNGPAELDPRQRLRTDLLLTRYRGTWRICG